MSYSVRHQVFVSSTFTDLKEERAEVIQAIWELDCIPTGMEAFVASNEGQWSVIQKVIDECDYYVLIIGGRYGSVSEGGLSYTEREYRYAKKIGLPVIAFVHAEPDQIAVGKTDLDSSARDKLNTFRASVMGEHPIRKWSSPSELGGLVSRSLIREVKATPRPGWIRNDGSSPIALLEQINQLTAENRALRDSIGNEEADDDTLASGTDEMFLFADREVFDEETFQRATEQILYATTWDAVFREIGPLLINEDTEQIVRRRLETIADNDPPPDGYYKEPSYPPTLSNETFSEVLIQFRALGLIAPGTKKRGVADKGSYWRLTPKGDKHLVKLLARRKSSSNDFDQLLS